MRLAKATVPALLLFILLAPATAHAGSRRFTYVYEALTHAKGEVEYEQWVTWKTDKPSDSSFDRFDIRHEIEIGLTDRVQLGIYVADWRYQDGRSVRHDRAEFRNSAVELIWNLSDPTVDVIGSALYGEIKFGPELFELEGKVILQKNIGKWSVAWNGTIEAEWEDDDYSEDKGEFQQTAGVSYQVNTSLTLGAELLHEIEFDDWEEQGPSYVAIGPNASVRTDDWWITVTPLFQVSDVDDEPDFQVRLLFGIEF